MILHRILLLKNFKLTTIPSRRQAVSREFAMAVRRSARNAERKESVFSGPKDNVQEIPAVVRKSTKGSEKTTTAKKVAAPRKRKVAEQATANQDDVTSINEKQHLDVTKPVEILTVPVMAPPAEPPSTPLPSKKRKKANPTSSEKLTPSRPTPSGVVSATAAKKDTDHMFDTLASHPRPASPHLANAPVLSPNSPSTVVVVADGESPAKKRRAKELPPDVGSPVKPGNASVDTLLSDAEAFLVKADQTGKLAKLIAGKRCEVFSPEGLREVVDPFTALASGVIGQQVSGQAASSIRKKFTALFPDTHPTFPTPSQVLTKDIPTLRTAGLSQRKAEYITGLAEKFASGTFTAEGLVGASDEQLIEQLVAVRGLGRWSVEMFACFGLKRMDVFSTGDLGVQRGMAAYMGRDVSKLKNKGGKWKYMSEAEMLSIASRFSPYRSLFMWYMWRIADVETEVLE
ncbi:DNA-3-methyladenine glycosylase II [Ascochyta lentis]